MKKLELKHLAPYLPYKLKIKHGDDLKAMNTGLGSSKHWIGVGAVIKWHGQIKADCKPVLRPLSDLTTEIKVNGKKFVPLRRIEEKGFAPDGVEMYGDDALIFGDSIIYGITEGEVHYNIIQKLFEWHFDVFDLISSGLAIDINTLPNNQNE